MLLLFRFHLETDKAARAHSFLHMFNEFSRILSRIELYRLMKKGVNDSLFVLKRMESVVSKREWTSDVKMG